MLNFYKIVIRIIAVVSVVVILLLGFHFAIEEERIAIFISSAIVASLYLVFPLAFAELLGAVAEMRGEQKQNIEYEPATLKDYIPIIVLLGIVIIGGIVLWILW